MPPITAPITTVFWSPVVEDADVEVEDEDAVATDEACEVEVGASY